MLKDVAHADVAKDDIDSTDANYDEYYDVRRRRKEFKLIKEGGVCKLRHVVSRFGRF